MDKLQAEAGVSIKEAERLLIEHGENVIEEHQRKSILKKLIEQLSSFLVILLLAAAVLSFFTGEVLDGALIMTIILLNALFGIYQEFKAEQAVAALKELSVSTIRVIRGGKEQQLDSKYLVPGDLIIIEEGVKIPADAVILESHSLELNESALTGESLPLVKTKGERIFLGTIVARGRGRARVTETGMRTTFGKIAEKLSSVPETLTPLQKKLTQVTEIIGIVGILISLLVFALSAMQGNGTFPSFLLAISLAVAVVPESLPAVMTIILSIGVKHMAARKAIVRRLSAIEALGNTTLIATDKTGTLTQNKMDVKYLYMDERQLSEKELVEYESSTVRHIVTNGIVCSTASLVMVHDHGSFEVLGDPTEGALLLLAHTRNQDAEVVRHAWELKDELPFNSVTKRMSVLVKKDKEYVYSKGAPESILAISSHIQIGDTIVRLTDEKRENVRKVITSWSEHGLRVLGFAYKDVTGDSRLFATLKAHEEAETDDTTLEHEGLVFLGLSALHDPPRAEAKQAIARARSAGIEVVMITGDNEKTAEAIGTSVGLVHEGDIIMTGAQLDEYTDQQLLKLLPQTRIFARTTPFHKSRIVALYQKRGEVVTVTGDGVNDAIALKQADVGVAMGRVGTDVARETSDMVIMDDNFATIVNAIEEGRNIVLRLRKAVTYLLTGNLTEGLTLVTGLLLGLPPILIPIQLLYINLISDGIPALAMAFSPHDNRVMRSKPRKGMVLLGASEYWYIITIGVVATIIVILTTLYTVADATTKQAAAFTVLALIQTSVFIDIWFQGRSKTKSLREYLSRIFFVTVLTPVLFQAAIVSIPFLAHIFKIEILLLQQFVMYLLISGSILVIMKLLSFLRRREF